MKPSAQVFELQKFLGPHAKGTQKIMQILQRGLALQQAAKLKEAEYCYQLVLRDNPDHPEALNLLGTLASKAKNHGIAIECLTKAGWSVHQNVDGMLSVAAKTSDDAIRINNLLVDHRFDVFHIALAQPSLEDIFLTLTTNSAAGRRAA